MKKVNEFSVLSMILDLQLAGKTVKQLSPRTSRNAVIKFAQAHCRLFWRENFKLVLNGLCSKKVSWIREYLWQLFVNESVMASDFAEDLEKGEGQLLENSRIENNSP